MYGEVEGFEDVGEVDKFVRCLSSSSWNRISHDEERVPVKERREDWGVRFLSSFLVQSPSFIFQPAPKKTPKGAYKEF